MMIIAALVAFLIWVIQKKQDIEGPGEEKEDKNINEVTKSNLFVGQPHGGLSTSRT